MRNEDKLIFILSRANLDGNEATQTEKLLKANLDWDYISRKSQEERVSCLIYHHLNNAEFKDYVPEHILEQWKNIYYTNSVRNTVIGEEAKKILKIFDEEKIKVIVLKGVFLAETIYKNIALRPFTDVDILIKKEDLYAADKILNSLGYPSPPYYPDALKSSSLSSINTLVYGKKDSTHFFIHLHWHLINSIWPIDFLVTKIDMEKIWSEAEPNKIDGIDCLTLAPHYLLIYLSEHSFTHSFDRSILLSDISWVLRYYKNRLNWNLVVREAKRFNLSLVLYYSLCFTSKLLNIEIPELRSIRLDKFGFLKKMSDFFICKGIRCYWLSYFIYFFMPKDFLSQIKFISKSIFPPPYVMAHGFNLPLSKINASHYYQRIVRNRFKFLNLYYWYKK